jgi:hypothetical protein
MRKRMSLYSCFRAGLAVAVGLIAGDAARAGTVPFTYAATASPTTLISSSGPNTATITETPVTSGSGTAETDLTTPTTYVSIASYALSRTSTAPTYPFDASITQDVTITDTASGKSATFVLTETFDVSVNGLYPNVTASITVAPSQTSGIMIGNYVYNIGVTNVNYGTTTYHGTIQMGLYATAVPEPSSLTLAGMGLAGALAVYARRRGRSR